jgi:hypothetical protein
MMIKKNKRIWIAMLTGLLIGTMALEASGGTVTAPIGVGEAEAALAEITRVRLETQQTFIDGVFEMRRNMSAEEWRAAFGGES